LYRDNGSKKPQRGLITQVASIVPGGIAAIQRRLTSTSDALANWLSAEQESLRPCSAVLKGAFPLRSVSDRRIAAC